MVFQSITTAKRLRDKIVLVRIDTNVPLGGRRVLDDTRLRQAVPTLRLLERRGAKMILLGHLGRPGGQVKESLSLKPIGYALGKLLRQPVRVLPPTATPPQIKQQVNQSLVMLENMRFNKGEDENSPVFTKFLAQLGHLYVNEAFSCSHRSSASLVGLPHRLPSFAGLSLVHEIESLERVRRNGQRPVVAIIGGAKIVDKLPVIEKLLPRLSAILIGGGVANTFLKARGYQIGSSLIDKSEVSLAKHLLKRAGRKIILPVDVVVDNIRTRRPEAWLKKPSDLGIRDKIVDIGTGSCVVYAQYLKKAKTIFWSGPLGQIEQPNWQHATLALGRLVSARANNLAYVVVGGGETVSFFHQHGLRADFFSTGGSAMLKFLAGEKLPALAALGYYKSK